MASIIFIAVQCCQCSTMQVKQRKKSSNKWTCVVCNQKQSVVKVFAQSFMAKDVRKVVQTFNMSRQLADQNQSLLFDQQTLVSSSPKQLDTHNHNKKRTDWTDYIHPQDQDIDNHNHNNNDNAGNVFDEKFVTELPKAVFKKPKLSHYSSSSSRNRNDNSYSPVFGKRTSSYTQLNSLDDEKEPTKSGGTIVDPNPGACMKQASDMFAHINLLKHRLYRDKGEPLHAAAIFAGKELMRRQTSKDAGASRWKDYICEDDSDNNLAAKAPSKLGQSAGASSKWSEYITQEDDDNADLMIPSLKNHPEKELTEYGGTIVDLNQSACMKQDSDMFAHSNLLKHQLYRDKGEPLHAAAIFAEKELMRRQTSKDTEASKWKDYIGEEDSDNNLVAKAPSKLGQKVGASSKWNEYITEEDDDNADLMIPSQKNHPGQWNDAAFCTTLYDQTAEEDIHPDFH